MSHGIVTRLQRCAHTCKMAWGTNSISTVTAEAAERIERLEKALDLAYVKMIDTAGFLRGHGDAAEIAASNLTRAVPEDFDGREEAVRAQITEESDHG